MAIQVNHMQNGRKGTHYVDRLDSQRSLLMHKGTAAIEATHGDRSRDREPQHSVVYVRDLPAELTTDSVQDVWTLQDPYTAHFSRSTRCAIRMSGGVIVP